MITQEIFCQVCAEITTHSFKPAGIWMCDNAHKDDGVCCHQCGDKLDENIVKIGKALGACQIVCEKCRKGRGIRVTSKTQPLIVISNKERGK